MDTVFFTHNMVTPLFRAASIHHTNGVAISGSKAVRLSRRTAPFRFHHKAQLALLSGLHLGRSSCLVHAQGQPSSIKVDSRDKPPAIQHTSGTEKKQETTMNNAEEYMADKCDKLIEVFLFQKPNPSDWRKLLAISKLWSTIRPYFYKRCRMRADTETNLELKQKLLKLHRVLNEIDLDMQKHDGLLKEIETNPTELEVVVARRRKDFSTDFFEHVMLIANKHYDDVEYSKKIVDLAKKCWKQVQAHDNASFGTGELGDAAFKLDEAYSLPSLESFPQSIDIFSGTNQLNPTATSLLSKVWGFARDTNATHEEIRDMMKHSYENAVLHLQKSLPKEVRIIKYLLDIDDPKELSKAFDDAFTPGEETQGKHVDMLYTTPKDLHKWVKLLLDSFYTNTRKGIFMEAKLYPDPTMNKDYLLREARKLKSPKVIRRLEALRRTLEEKYL